MAVKRCPQCDAEYELNQRFCSVDGAVLRGPGAAEQVEGSIIGGREVLRQLGEGGMGTVYLAKSIRTGRLDALKIIRPDLVQSADAVGRFNREAMNAVRIRHPNVAIVYDVGDTEDGTPYIAMEYIDGASLSDILKRSPILAPARAATFVHQIGQALQAAHELGIVHRDLKPENVMIARNGSGESVKLVDFGISKVASDANQQLTSTGVMIGSPAYMSPEQVIGGRDIGSASDIYSLALVAYRMLTGRLPFDGDGGELMNARVIHPPHSLANVKPDVTWGDELERVMAKGLAADVADRYASAVEFATDFERAARQIAIDDTTVRVDHGEQMKLISAHPPRPQRSLGTVAALTGGGLAVVTVAVWLATRGGTVGAATDKPTGAVPRADTAGAPSAAAPPAAGGNSKSANNATISPPAVTKAPSRSTVSFAAPSLRIRAAGLTSLALRSVDSAVQVASTNSAVRLVDATGERADIELEAGASGRIAVRAGIPYAPSVAATADSVLTLIRYVLANRDLEGLTKGASRGDLTFDFDQRTLEMHVGDSFRFRLRSVTGGYLTILDVAPSGNLTVLNPNTAAADVRHIAANAETVVPGRGAPAVATGPPAGPGQLWAIITARPLNLPVAVSRDAAKAAAQIRREVERVVRSGDEPWSVLVLPYELKASR